MATYNTFVVVDCKKRTPVLVTSSARKARGNLSVGYRVEVWSDNKKATVIYANDTMAFKTFIESERTYIREKQERRTNRNKKRKEWSNNGRS